MPVYQIKRGDTVISEVFSSGSMTEEVMNVTIAELQFSLPYFEEFRFGDSINVAGTEFKINPPYKPTWRQISANNFSYTIKFQAVHYDLNKVQLLGLDENNNPTQTEFTYTGTAIGLIDLIILNGNRIYPTWSRGTVDETDIKTFQFSGDTCRYGLTQLTEQYGIEFWFSGADMKTINLTKQGQDTGLVFQRGKDKGLIEVEQQGQETPFATRWYIEGSADNLIPSEYGHERLQLPNGMRYIEDQAKIDRYGLIERTVYFEDIKPQRTGAVSSVPSVLVFADNTLDFDINDARVSNEIDPRVIFETGLLAGLDFVIESYDPDSKQIKLTPNDRGFPSIEVPIQINDIYKLVDINMPQQYIDAAESDLLEAGSDYYENNSYPKVKFIAPVDAIYVAENNIPVELGNYVTIEVPEAGVSVKLRIIKKTTPLDKPLQIEIELAEEAVLQGAVRSYIRQEKVNRQIGVVTEQAKNASAQALNARRTVEIVRSVTSFLSTTIDGNVVATGTLIVGDALGNNNAGITGVIEAGDPLDSVWLWGGATYANRETAPFRVNQRGEVYATAGYIGGFEILANNLQTAGTDTNTARFVLYPDGASGFMAYIDPAGKWVGIGSQVFPAQSGAEGVARFENTKSNPGFTNHCAYFRAEGGSTNIALEIASGDVNLGQSSKINRLSQKTTRVTGNFSVTDESVVVQYGDGTVLLPSNPNVGRTVHIVKINASMACYARSNDKTLRIRGGIVGPGDTMLIPWAYSFVWDGQYWVVFSAQGE